VIPYDDAFDTLHMRRANRDVAARWMYVGSRPIVLIVGAFRCEFDGERLSITTTHFVSRRTPRFA